MGSKLLKYNYLKSSSSVYLCYFIEFTLIMYGNWATEPTSQLGWTEND